MSRQNIAGHCQQMFVIKMFVDITQQCFAVLPQVNFPANNLNFHWRWRWWDWIQTIFLNLFNFGRLVSILGHDWWDQKRYYLKCCQKVNYYWLFYTYIYEVSAFQIILTFYDPFQGTLVEVVHTLLTYKLLQLQVTQKQTLLLHQLNGVNRKSTSDVSLPTWGRE